MKRLAMTLAAVGLSLTITAAGQAAPAAGTIVKTDGGTFVFEGDFDPNESTPLQGMSFTAQIDVGQGGLSVNGTFIDGTLTQGVLSGHASATLTMPFTYTGGDVKAGLAPGAQVLLEVGDSSLKGIELPGLEVNIRHASGLVLEGTVDGKYSPGSGLNFDGRLNVVETFVYQSGHVTATLGQGGQVALSVVGDLLQQATLAGLAITVDDGSGLRLGGTVDGDYEPASGISFESKLTLADDFIYQKGDVSATLPSGSSVSTDVEADLLILAGMTGVELDLAVDDTLKLEGSANGEYKPGSGLEFDGSLLLTEPFELQKGDVSTSLQPGATIEVTVESDLFQGGTLPDAAVDIEVMAGDQPLYLRGTINAELSKEGDIDFDGSLQLTDPFVFQRGDVTAHLKPGGRLSVTVVANQFKGALLEDLEVQVEVAIGGGELRLGGTVEGSMDADGGLDFEAELALLSEFEYVHGPVRVRWNTGSLDVTVEQSQFVRARIFDLPLYVDLTLPDGQVAPLDGTIERGQLTPDRLLLRASVHLDRRLIVRQGPWPREVGPADGVLTLLPRYALLRIGWALIVVPLT
jgi:hypothetical protein